MQSIWRKTAEMPAFPTLTENLKTDAVVIGGGMAGVLTAYLLGARGVDCVVLEANRVAGGVTDGTTAKITAQHDICYSTMIRQFGAELAGQYAAANLEAIEDYAKLIEGERIDCDFRRVATHLYAEKPSEVLEQELRAAETLGLPAEMVTETELPFPVWGALRFREQAMFHPLKFLAHIAAKCRIYENSRVQSVEADMVTTEGGEVRAEHIVVATHFPFINRPGYYFARMHQSRSYVLVLEGAEEIEHAYLGIDGERLSLRGYGGHILLGGGGHRTGENQSGGKYAGLVRAAKAIWPGSREVTRWSAQDCVTHDNIPYIGQYGADTPGLYVATGFRKWGMTSSMVAARILSAAIAGGGSPYPVFSPQRTSIAPSIKGLAKDGATAVKGLTKQIFHAPLERLDEVPVGRGELVSYRGDKLAVYRDESGRAYGVDTACTHLGCELSFNADEASWDCPCHGSRFHHDGTCLSGPAQRDLEVKSGLCGPPTGSNTGPPDEVDNQRDK
ncbi:MAG: FAD-dependent oxidoreductase [Oscillospiraceae bacterium]|nr:FAD-dependent oxidoreductase [Oscillospiraceae bacterium]